MKNFKKYLKKSAIKLILFNKQFHNLVPNTNFSAKNHKKLKNMRNFIVLNKNINKKTNFTDNYGAFTFKKPIKTLIFLKYNQEQCYFLYKKNKIKGLNSQHLTFTAKKNDISSIYYIKKPYEIKKISNKMFKNKKNKYIFIWGK